MGPNIGLIGEHDHAEVSTDWFKGKKTRKPRKFVQQMKGCQLDQFRLSKIAIQQLGLGLNFTGNIPTKRDWTGHRQCNRSLWVCHHIFQLSHINSNHMMI